MIVVHPAAATVHSSLRHLTEHSTPVLEQMVVWRLKCLSCRKENPPSHALVRVVWGSFWFHKIILLIRYFKTFLSRYNRVFVYKGLVQAVAVWYVAMFTPHDILYYYFMFFPLIESKRQMINTFYLHLFVRCLHFLWALPGYNDHKIQSHKLQLHNYFCSWFWQAIQWQVGF